MVPQFIDVEDKIIGPISARQFIILLAMLLLVTLEFKIFTLGKFLLSGLPTIALAITFSFVRINGQPFHVFLLNMVQTFRKPRLRVWDKSLIDPEVRQFMKTEEAPAASVHVAKAPATASRLAELTLIVNTGGVYNPDDYR